MNKSIASPLIAGLMIVALLVYSVFSPQKELPIPESEGIEVAQVGVDLTADQRRADMLVQNLQSLPIDQFTEILGTEVIGTLAPIALSPFFALTCLSGASLLSEMGFLPDGITNNIMMSTNSPLHNEAVFLGLLALTVLTSLPKLTTVSKGFAQAVDQLEGYSGIIAALSVQVLSNISLDEPAVQEVAMVYSAGVFTFSLHGLVSFLLMVFSAINIFVVNAIKFFFEILVWISPIPTVDAIFEAANKAFAGLLVTIYLISPTAATVLNLLIFLVCLSIFAWTYRRVVFMRCVLGDPVLGWLAENVFRMRKMTANSTRLPGSIADQISGEADVVVKAFVGKKQKGLKKKTKGYLVHADGTTYFAKPKLIGKPKVKPLTGEGIYPEVRSGFLSHSVVFNNSLGDTTQKILFTKRYSNVLGSIHTGLKARGDQVGEDSFSSISELGKSLGSSVKSGDKTGLQSELG